MLPPGAPVLAGVRRRRRDSTQHEQHLADGLLVARHLALVFQHEVLAALALEERISPSFDRAILLFYLAEGSAKEGDLESARQLLTRVSHYRELTTASAQRTEILWWVSTFELSFMLGVPRQAMEAILQEVRNSNNDLLAAQCWILLMGIADNSCDLPGGQIGRAHV